MQIVLIQSRFKDKGEWYFEYFGSIFLKKIVSIEMVDNDYCGLSTAVRTVAVELFKM